MPQDENGIAALQAMRLQAQDPAKFRRMPGKTRLQGVFPADTNCRTPLQERLQIYGGHRMPGPHVRHIQDGGQEKQDSQNEQQLCQPAKKPLSLIITCAKDPIILFRACVQFLSYTHQPRNESVVSA